MAATPQELQQQIAELKERRVDAKKRMQDAVVDMDLPTARSCEASVTIWDRKIARKERLLAIRLNEGNQS